MKIQKLLSGTILIVTFLFILSHTTNLLSYRPSEVFPDDIYLDTVRHRQALVLVAHDDDAAMFAGTLAKLRAAGWKVHFMTFYAADKGLEMDDIRKNEAMTAGQLQGFANIDLIDFKMLSSAIDDTKPKYMPVPKSEFKMRYKYDELKAMIKDAMVNANPSVVFSLDSEIGGYGHSEHVLVSSLAIEVALESNQVAATTVHKIYQCVIPNSLEEKINSGLPVYEAAKQVYNVSGMPEPTVQIDIYKYSQEKKNVLLAYKSQHKNLKKFMVGYHLFPHWLYFLVFDREFFRVIDLGSASGVFE